MQREKIIVKTDNLHLSIHTMLHCSFLISFMTIQRETPSERRLADMLPKSSQYRSELRVLTYVAEVSRISKDSGHHFYIKCLAPNLWFSLNKWNFLLRHYRLLSRDCLWYSAGERAAPWVSVLLGGHIYCSSGSPSFVFWNRLKDDADVWACLLGCVFDILVN